MCSEAITSRAKTKQTVLLCGGPGGGFGGCGFATISTTTTQTTTRTIKRPPGPPLSKTVWLVLTRVVVPVPILVLSNFGGQILAVKF